LDVKDAPQAHRLRRTDHGPDHVIARPLESELVPPSLLPPAGERSPADNARPPSLRGSPSKLVPSTRPHLSYRSPLLMGEQTRERLADLRRRAGVGLRRRLQLNAK